MITSILYELWPKLTPTEKTDVCRTFWDAHEPILEQTRIEALKHLSFTCGEPEARLWDRPNSQLAKLMENAIYAGTPWAIIANVLLFWLRTRHKAVHDIFYEGVAGGERAHDSQTPATDQFLRDQLRKLKEKKDHRLLAICCVTYFGSERGCHYLQNMETAVPAEGLDLFGIFEKIALNSKEATDDGTDENAFTRFTKLDDLLQQTIFTAETKQSNATSFEAIEEVVEDFIKLNTSRPQSYFHRGVLHGTFNRPYLFHFPGANETLRLWYFCGVLNALHRKQDWAGCLTAC